MASAYSRTAAKSPRSNAQLIEALSRLVNNGRMSRAKLGAPVIAADCSEPGAWAANGDGPDPTVAPGGPAVPQSQRGTGMRGGGCAPGWLLASAIRDPHSR